MNALLQSLLAHPLRLVGTAVIIGLLIVSIFIINSNCGLRHELNDEKILRGLIEKREKRKEVSFDSLILSVSERDKSDSIRAIRDSALTAKLTALENSIITIHENYTTIAALPVNEFLELLTGYIDSAEGKITH